jgi:uncharacterized protein
LSRFYLKGIIMEKKGRNDPCPCGSGKKYKSCCWGKEHIRKKMTAKWLNQPHVPNLIERTFGDNISKTFGQQPPVLPPAVEDNI